MDMRETRMVMLVLAAGLSGTVQAALHDRGGGLIYDDALNVTWLQDANYAKTSGYDADGLMTWHEATAWAEQLNINGYNDWRLPTTLQPDASCSNQAGGDSFGYNCTGSELGHLFYEELGGYVEVEGGLTTTYISNYGPFSNAEPIYVQVTMYVYLSDGAFILSESNVPPTPDSVLVGLMPTLDLLPKAMWSATESSHSNGEAWAFDMNSGSQDVFNKTETHFAWAVRDGDVAAIPEPETYAMFLAGLGLVGAAARRRTKSKA
jgi:hypothetical protein